MNDRNTLVMIDLITSTHPDREYVDEHGQPHRCTSCSQLTYWTVTQGWTHHSNHRKCSAFTTRKEQQ